MARTSVRPHEGPKALQTLTTLGYRQVRENPRTGALRPHVTAAARAVAQRVQVAEHTLRRHRVLPHTRDDLAFPATLPSSHD